MRKVLTFAVLMFVPLLAYCDSNGVVVSVPEPGTLSLLLLGLAAVGAIKLRNKIRK